MLANDMMSEKIGALSEKCVEVGGIDTTLFGEYDVKKGLRDKSGVGVLAGLTKISTIEAFDVVDGKKVPCDGRLYYRGYNILDLVKWHGNQDNLRFEESTYLLLFGELPTKEQLTDFKELLASMRQLPTNFVRDVIMKAPSKDMMNSLSKSILTLASYDNAVADLSIPNVLRQCLMLTCV